MQAARLSQEGGCQVVSLVIFSEWAAEMSEKKDRSKDPFIGLGRANTVQFPLWYAGRGMDCVIHNLQALKQVLNGSSLMTGLADSQRVTKAFAYTQVREFRSTCGPGLSHSRASHFTTLASSSPKRSNASSVATHHSMLLLLRPTMYPINNASRSSPIRPEARRCRR